MLSFVGKFLAGLAATLGLAAVARKYTEPPPEGFTPGSAPPDGHASAGTSPDGSGAPVAPLASAPVAEHMQGEYRPRLGWSKPKPEVIPEPTYWPSIFGLGLAFLMWGFISNIFVWGMGFILLVVAIVGWIGDLRNEFS